MIRHACRDTWRVLRSHWLPLLLILVLVSWPLDLRQATWLPLGDVADTPEMIWRYLRFSRAFDLFLRVVPDAAMMFLFFGALAGRRTGFLEAIHQGLRNYGRMWWTRWLSELSYLSLLLLVLPGCYLLTRWAFCEPAVMADGGCGSRALARSWELTRGVFWRLVGILLVGGLVYVAACTLLVGGLSMLVGDDGRWGEWLGLCLASGLSVVKTGFLCALYTQLSGDREPGCPEATPGASREC